mmetsp:Transcript_3735/g.5087  ORF Transcript_3735/g.5087 Transcript_3735/m.5087 type:complete len:219 (-) Transcript_3735:1921-2577(-)
MCCPTASNLFKTNFPFVKVPVLSKTTFDTLPKASKLAPPLTMIPRCAVAAKPAAYVTGVDIVSAQGQAITIIIKPFNVQYRPVSLPQNQGMVHISPAIRITTGVYFFANPSTNFSVGLRLACASSTNLIKRETAESSTDVVVCINKASSPILILPPATVSPIFFVTGTASPVNELSSTALIPSTTIPSVAILSPVRTLKVDPTGTFSAGTIITSFVVG